MFKLHDVRARQVDIVVDNVHRTLTYLLIPSLYRTKYRQVNV